MATYCYSLVLVKIIHRTSAIPFSCRAHNCHAIMIFLVFFHRKVIKRACFLVYLHRKVIERVRILQVRIPPCAFQAWPHGHSTCLHTASHMSGDIGTCVFVQCQLLTYICSSTRAMASGGDITFIDKDLLCSLPTAGAFLLACTSAPSWVCHMGVISGPCMVVDSCSCMVLVAEPATQVYTAPAIVVFKNRQGTCLPS
jgi:hypothetical protein